MTLICEQCEKPIEFRPCDRNKVTIRCSCGAVYEIDPVKMGYRRVVELDKSVRLMVTAAICPHCATELVGGKCGNCFYEREAQ